VVKFEYHRINGFHYEIVCVGWLRGQSVNNNSNVIILKRIRRRRHMRRRFRYRRAVVVVIIGGGNGAHRKRHVWRPPRHHVCQPNITRDRVLYYIHIAHTRVNVYYNSTAAFFHLKMCVSVHAADVLIVCRADVSSSPPGTLQVRGRSSLISRPLLLVHRQ